MLGVNDTDKQLTKQNSSNNSRQVRNKTTQTRRGMAKQRTTPRTPAILAVRPGLYYINP